MLIQLNNVTKNFVVNEIFSNVKMEINDKDRVAIVGRNGAGKSTLLKIISGELSFDSGERTVSKNTTIGYLSQEFIVREDLSIYEEMITCFDEIISLEANLEKLSYELTPENIENDPGLLDRFDRLQNEVLTHKDYHYKSKIESVLYGLDFTKDVFDKKISTFSGGEKTRLSMAKLLLSEPDLLILDEPTNHLDMENVAWLENYLSSYNGAIVIVSHDRYFLDKVVNVVYNLEFGKLKKYVGFNKVQLTDNNYIKKEYPEILFDFNAIAQGYTSDVVADFLNSKGIKNYIVEIAGEMFLKGKNTIENKAWTIGVENPIKPLDEKELITTIQFENQGLATSGNYRKVWTDSNGRKYVHSINPITGRATQSDVLSATVVAPSTMYADGYATMFMVMGMEKSKAFLAKHPDLAVLLVYSNDKNEELTFKTNPFKKLEEKN